MMLLWCLRLNTTKGNEHSRRCCRPRIAGLPGAVQYIRKVESLRPGPLKLARPRASPEVGSFRVARRGAGSTTRQTTRRQCSTSPYLSKVGRLALPRLLLIFDPWLSATARPEHITAGDSLHADIVKPQIQQRGTSIALPYRGFAIAIALAHRRTTNRSAGRAAKHSGDKMVPKTKQSAKGPQQHHGYEFGGP